MQQFIKDELVNGNEFGLIQVGDVVEWTNDYGLVFTNKVIGFNYERAYNKEYNKFVHLDTDCYWFPHDEQTLRLKGSK